MPEVFSADEAGRLRIVCIGMVLFVLILCAAALMMAASLLPLAAAVVPLAAMRLRFPRASDAS